MVFGYLLWAGIIVGTGLGVLAGIGYLLIGFDRFEEERAIRTTPVASLDSVAVGPTAVQGEIQPVDREIESLYACDSCVAYELDVTDVGSDRSQTRIDRTAVAPFDIVTDEGSIRVAESGFDFHVTADRRWKHERKSHQPADAQLRRFERNWELPPLRTGDTRQYSASYLCPGDEVYAYGTADIDDNRSDGSAKPLVLTDRDDLFFVSDRSEAELLRERRFALAKKGILGVCVSVVSLALFLWVTGIAHIFLGA